ncbi:hypothetical protein Lal_00012304 [Lupinus albus]|nr:hypothetical protein Lal_00012304 [Lupinus albus]
METGRIGEVKFEGKTTVPVNFSSRELQLDHWKAKDARILSWILSCVDPQFVLTLRPYKTAKSMLEYFKKVYNQDKSAQPLQLESNIAGYTKGYFSIHEYYSGFNNLRELTNIIYINVPEDSLAAVREAHEQSKRDHFLEAPEESKRDHFLEAPEQSKRDHFLIQYFLVFANSRVEKIESDHVNSFQEIYSRLIRSSSQAARKYDKNCGETTNCSIWFNFSIDSMYCFQTRKFESLSLVLTMERSNSQGAAAASCAELPCLAS